ncbi:ATP-dependent helicase [Candidatus Peregrinibacteria bacterium]|nr:ATP-dependent helicase [Candidatus Peregrinibacteria bacterium]
MNLSNPTFSSAFASLNPAQKEAVETVYGPVLVVAGPGTGKTQVLALRIANILQKTDTNPGNILALTFTENAAISMRKRLLSFIGPDAHSVHINTFHGFCQDIISEFSEKFIFAKRLDALDDITKIQMMTEIIRSLKLDHLRPFSHPNFFIKDIQKMISDLKREGVSPEKFLELSEHEKEEFENISEEEKFNTKTRKIKGKYLEMETKITKNFEFHKVYEAYQKKLLETGFYDFDDMIAFVVKKMETDEDFAWTLRERYQFLLVDEFQDTNGLQMRILELFAEPPLSPLSGGSEPPEFRFSGGSEVDIDSHSQEEGANIFAVGDDDQSIYRFQGAALENILFFREKFPEAKIIPLTENYRSTQAVLDLASQSIAQNEERLTKKIQGLLKDLSSARNTKNILPEIHIFSHEEQEHFFLAEKIHELHEKKKIPYGEISVLFRNNAEGFELLDFLEKQNIPASFSGKGNALRTKLIRQILNTWRLLLSPSDDALFFECLHYSFWNIPIEVSWNIWEKVRRTKERKDGKLFHYFLVHRSEKEELPREFLVFAEHIERWRADLSNLSLIEFFQKMMTESGILESLANPLSPPYQGEVRPLSGGKDIPSLKNIEEINAINALFAEVKKYSEGNFQTNLESFLHRLDIREEFDLPLESRDILSSAENVQLLTVHKSKGLEFEAVFLIHGNRGKWGDKRIHSKISLPEGFLKFSHEENENEEERRLFYVAMTRTKTYLFLSRSAIDVTQSEKSESRFFTELPKDQYSEVQHTNADENQAVQVLKGQIFWSPKKSSVLPEDFLKSALDPENFALSHSAFENYRENPQKFLWENVLNVPTVKHPSAILGTALHRALEEFFRLFPKEDRESSEKVFLESLHREALTEDEFESLKKEGKEILKKYFMEYQGKFTSTYKTELNFRSHGVFLDGKIPLTGKIDKVEWISESQKTVKIIDYKATSPKSENEIRGLRDSDAGKITAGRYFRQMVFYSLLADFSSKFPEKAEVCEIDFLIPNDSGAFKKLTFSVTPEEKNALAEEIRLVWKRIQSLDFRPISLWGEKVREEVFAFGSLEEE